MNKRVATLAVTLLLLINFVYAIQVTEIAQGLESNSVEITKLKGELTARMLQLDQRLGSLATEDKMTELLNSSLLIHQQLLDQFRMLLTISFIIIILAGIGLLYSVYFFFKSKGRL